MKSKKETQDYLNRIKLFNTYKDLRKGLEEKPIKNYQEKVEEKKDNVIYLKSLKN